MLKNTQIKIILIFMLLGIICITTLGIIYIDRLEQINTNIVQNDNFSREETIQEIDLQLKETKIIMWYVIGIFLIISIIVAIFVSKVIVTPISKLIKSAEKIAAGEEVEIKHLPDGKNNNEVDELVKAFSLMTSELKENLNETARQKRQIETILLHMTDGIIAFDIHGEILHINPAAKDLLKLTVQDDTFEKIFKKLNLSINLEKTIYLDNWTTSEHKLKIQDKYVNLFFAPFKDENEMPEGIIVVVQDITEHVKLDNMRKEFVADVSHELKTPITSIMGYADTLLEGEYEKEIKDKFLNVIASEARRMARLVSDLLTLSKYDSENNDNKLEKTEFDLGELVKHTLESLKLEIEKKKHKTECFVTANVPLVYADKYGIERVVINILTNSIKYTKEGGTIKIYVGFVYNDAYVKIIDNGIGIPEEDLNRIFERFYRVDKARTRELGGTGLGLSIAKEILDKNNGSINIKSTVGKGTEVVIRIPTFGRKEQINNGENE